MAKRKSNTSVRLRKMKIQYQNQIRQLKDEFSDQLLVFEQGLRQQLYSQAFYNEALMNLCISENEVDSDILIGAVVTQRWLQYEGQQLSLQLDQARSRLQRPG